MTRLFATHIPSSFRTSLTQFFTDRITLETDFINEVSNAEHLRESVLQEPSLRNVVHIPKTYSKLCTKRVMVAEWIDGVPISETELLTGSWKSNAVIGTPVISEKPSNSAEEQDTYGLGLPGKDVMSVMLDLFCAQTFLFGQVHCDPVNTYEPTSFVLCANVCPSTLEIFSSNASLMASLSWYVVK